MRRFVVILYVTVLMITFINGVGLNDSYGDEGVLSSLNFSKDKKNWWVYKGKISITKESKNIKEGSGALEWRYEIRKKKWNLLARIRINPSLFKGKNGISLWLKSDRKAPLLFQFVEKDRSNYQYLNFGNPVELDWKIFEICFDELRLDPDSSDENKSFDPDQVDRMEIVEIAGFFETLSEGPRTVWIDDVRLVDKFKTSRFQKVEGPGKATRGTAYDKAKFGLGILVDKEQEKVIFPTRNNLNPLKGTIEMWIKPLFDGGGMRRVLLSCEDPLDIFGREGNRVIFYLQGRKVVFQVNKLVLSSQELLFKKEEFYHLAMGWDDQGAILYFDGQKVDENKEIISLGRISKEIVIGNLRDGTAPSQTIIDELRISSVKRDKEEIAVSAKKSMAFKWDRGTLLLAHFDDSPLPEIDIRHKGSKIGEKVTFELNIPTPVFARKTKNRYVLRFEVFHKDTVVMKGEKLLTLTMGDLSGKKNHARLDIGTLKRGAKYKLRLKLFHHNDLLNRGEENFSVFPLSEKYEEKVSVSSKNRKKGWFPKVQVYGIIPLSIEEARKFNITVNGVWGGILTADPILPAKSLSPSIRKTYKSELTYVSAMHKAGLITSGAIIAFSGHKTLFERWPELKDAISRTAQGEEATSWMVDSYAMSANNPKWNNWMINQGKRAIDAGVDLIMIDDIQEFLFPFQFGFDEYSIEGFKKYLRSRFTLTELSTQFGIINIDTVDIAQRIASTATRTYENRINTDPFVEVFARFQEENNYQTKRQLFKAIRSYANKKDKKVAITANIYALGTTRFDGYWSKGLYFSELVDFFTFENLYSVGGKKVLEMSFPRGKWLAWEKLSRAATKSPPVPLLAAESLEKIAARKNFANYLYILFAEAYANQSAYMLYHIPAYKMDKQWKKCADAAGFILNQHAIYEAEQSVYSSVAVLYLYGEGIRTKSFNYLGIAQALAESNIPFEVVFSGDGYYLKDTLTLRELSKYTLILIPSVLDITDNQKEVIKKYVAEGGRAIIFDPWELNIYKSEGEIKFGKGSFIIIPSLKVEGKLEDLGTAYLLTYNDMIRKNIEKIVNTYIESAIIIDGSNREIIAYPYHQYKEKRLVIHLINYDHNLKNDKVKNKRNLRIRIKKPDFYTEQREAFMISPDFKGRITLPIILRNGYLELKIPELKVYNIIIL